MMAPVGPQMQLTYAQCALTYWMGSDIACTTTHYAACKMFDRVQLDTASGSVSADFS